MKPIIRILFFTLTVVLLCRCEKENPQVIIPDNNFLNALIELGVDTNGDGYISPAEAEVITNLNISEDSISDLTGIEKFVNLDTLFCFKNQLTTLDVSNNKELVFLNCWTNQLNSLDVSNNTALELLICGNNQLTTLDVSNCAEIKWLYCESNPLGTIDVSDQTSLEYLRCYNSQLTTLDVSNCTALEQLFSGNNKLSTLDVSGNIALTYISLKGMPTLNKVCVWEMPFPPAGVSVDTTGSPNVYFTTNCN